MLIRLSSVNSANQKKVLRSADERPLIHN
jgi:hypothetical protein